MADQHVSRIGDLDIDQDLTVQERSWHFQRFSWGLLVIMIGLAVLGFFGNGPLSRARAGDPASLEVEYSRFERRTQEASMTLRPPPTMTGTVRFWIHRDFLQEQRLERIAPLPERVEMASDRYVFDVRLSGDRPEIQIYFLPDRFGPRTARLGLLGGPELSFRQFVYP